jgi:hypothetical protein
MVRANADAFAAIDATLFYDSSLPILHPDRLGGAMLYARNATMTTGGIKRNRMEIIH